MIIGKNFISFLLSSSSRMKIFKSMWKSKNTMNSNEGRKIHWWIWQPMGKKRGEKTLFTAATMDMSTHTNIQSHRSKQFFQPRLTTFRESIKNTKSNAFQNTKTILNRTFSLVYMKFCFPTKNRFGKLAKIGKKDGMLHIHTQFVIFHEPSSRLKSIAKTGWIDHSMQNSML